jgi:type I restriction enzyme S subunit
MKFEKLGNIAEIIAGQSPPSSTYNSEGKGIPFFQGKADYGIKYPTVRYWCNEPTKISLPDDILISMRAPVGPVNINIVESCIGRGLSAIRVKKNVSRDYIYFWLKLNQHIISAKETGSTFKAITQKILNEIVVPFPSYEYQLHIANLLSKAENLISQRKESIRLLDEFLKSTFLEMFGDPETNPKRFPFTELEKLCSTIVDCPHSTPLKSKEITIYPCIRTSELTNGYISWDSMQYLDESEYKLRTQRLVPEEGDIVYGREGTFGEAIRIPKTHKFSLGQRAMLFRPNFKKTNSIFLWAMVRSEFVYRQAKKKNSGSTVGHVNVKDIRQFRILYPPITLQIQFAQIVEKTEALKTQYQQSLSELENLYGSLSQKAFKGELTV